MDFCKECDKFISLYLDELLDDKGRIEFLKHIDDCYLCAAKLKEATYISSICREDHDIQLPENFSSSLHRRLLEVSSKESKSKFEFFVYNRKIIASLSTAAIVVISLLAYNLLPQMGLSKDSTSIASETTQVQASSATDSSFGGSGDKSSMPSGDTGTSARVPSNDTAGGTQADSSATAKDADVTIKLKKQVPTDKIEISDQAKKFQGKAKTSPSSDESLRAKEPVTYAMKIDDQDNTKKYFSNYAEINVKVSPTGIEIESLRKFMKDLGAIELKPVTINSIVENQVDSSMESSAESKDEAPTDSTTASSLQTQILSPEYIDFYLPLNLYSTLESQAIKYKLEINTKNDIIKNDFTKEYNELNTQKIEIDKKIADALLKGENSSTLEDDRTILIKKMDKIITESGMITVRTFFIP